MLKTAANPEGLPIEVFDGLRASLTKDRSQFYKDLAVQFNGANRPGAEVSQGVLAQWATSWRAHAPNRSPRDLEPDSGRGDLPHPPFAARFL
jgi:non-heme chloroperoxidase